MKQVAPPSLKVTVAPEIEHTEVLAGSTTKVTGLPRPAARRRHLGPVLRSVCDMPR